MALKKYCIIALVAIMAMGLPAGSPAAAADEYSPESSPGPHTGWMTETSTVNSSWGFNRTFEYYIPSSYTGSTAVPLLFSFHGLGNNGLGQIDLTKFDVLAEQEGFIAVFPDSTNLDPTDPRWSAYSATLPPLTNSNIMWNCGDITGIPIAPLQYYAGVDDAGFVADMVNWFEANYAINASRIYATGMSNGAMFSYFLAFNLTGVFAGIAPVTGPMDLNLGWNATTPPATTVIAIRSATDPIIPEAGECSPVFPTLCTNYAYSTPDTITYWCGVDNITTEPVETVWGPTTRDATVVHRYVYSRGTGGTQVILCWINGAGHTWPGGPQYLAETVVGKVTTHVDGSALIWKHLPPEKYYLKISSTRGGSVATPDHTTFANINSAGTTMFFYPGTGNTVVNLVGTPFSGNWEFVNWTGDVSTIADVNTATTSITIIPSKDYEITANFQLKSEEPEPEPTPSGGMCFIATAAYGTSTAKQLDVLREFRDDALLKSTAGSRLVDLYYQVSPPIADFISEDTFVRTLVRELMIDPIVWLTEATRDIWQN
jgi:polyhydroxybutyrate depolymerase